MSNQTKGPDLTVLLGGTAMEAKKLDGSSEQIKVRQLPIRDLPTYLGVFDDERRSVELFADRPDGWADALTHESFFTILEEGERLNLDFLAKFAARRNARREKVMPGIQDQVLAKFLSRLPSSPPPSPPASN